jgi:hypothetical protein
MYMYVGRQRDDEVVKKHKPFTPYLSLSLSLSLFPPPLVFEKRR